MAVVSAAKHSSMTGGHDGIAVGEVSVDRIFMGLLILIPVRNTTKSPSMAALNRPG
jgi:hypothetical protein